MDGFPAGYYYRKGSFITFKCYINYEGLWGGAYSQSIIIDVHDVPSVFSYVASYVPIHQLKL